MPHIEENLNLDLNREKRYFYGVSNGAGFGMSLLNSNPELIGTYICLSTFGGDIQENQWNGNIKYPKIYLRYGSEEPEFLKLDANFLKTTFDELNQPINIKSFEGGHDYLKWHQEFENIIIELFKTN